MRLLHAGLPDDPGAVPRRAIPTRPRTRSATRCRATSAAAPATSTSSPPCCWRREGRAGMSRLHRSRAATEAGWDLTATGALDRWQRRFEEVEPQLHAFVEEPDRFGSASNGRAPPCRPARRAPRRCAGCRWGSRTSSASTACRPSPAAASPPVCSTGRRRRRSSPALRRRAHGRQDGRPPKSPTSRPARRRTHAHPAHAGRLLERLGRGGRGRAVRPLALGTQTIGSIGRPAAFCGVVGFKPSCERIPRDGLMPPVAVARPRGRPRRRTSPGRAGPPPCSATTGTRTPPVRWAPAGTTRAPTTTRCSPNRMVRTTGARTPRARTTTGEPPTCRCSPCRRGRISTP